MNAKVYVTTPIYYANGLSHIGHLLTTTCADVYARHQRLLIGAKNVFFTTGLDEHGTTVEQAAKKEGRTDYQKYVDERAEFWKKDFKETLISLDYFARTTNDQHKKFSQEFIRKLVANGDVYKDKYIGKYCYGCEKFLTKSDLDDRGLCQYHRPDQVSEVKEDNYYFKLSKYADQVAKLIESDELHIVPAGKKKEILSRIKQGVEDQSISRPKTKVPWGVEFPDDTEQVIYVWVEALLNYLSSLEIAGKSEKEKEALWDGVVHFMGKEINWFHNFIWPAMLLSAGHPIAKKSFVHSFINIAGQKISKSLGNKIDPSELIGKYGIDGARYIVLSALPYRDDINVTWDALDAKYNADLANGLGNLVSRVSKLASEAIANPVEKPAIYSDLINEHADLKLAYEEFRFHNVIEELSKLVDKTNEYVSKETPWKKEGKEKKKILEQAIKNILEIATLAEPIMPKSAETIKKVFASSPIKPAKPLFEKVGI